MGVGSDTELSQLWLLSPPSTPPASRLPHCPPSLPPSPPEGQKEAAIAAPCTEAQQAEADLPSGDAADSICCTNADADAGDGAMLACSRKRQRGMIITIDVRSACESAHAEAELLRTEADSLRAQLMGAWKANASLKREHEALKQDARSQA
eukprot:5490569-Pleurochrysis_carterae.AAC.1